ncbi:MAG: OmpA family protein [Rhodospirillales bacterium]
MPTTATYDSVAARTRRLPILAGVAVVLLISGCSSVPDAVNPVEWYRSTVDAFSDDEDAAGDETATAEQEVPGADKEFPKLSSVPERPSAQANLSEGLVADPNAPKYAPSVALQGEDDGATVPVAEAPEAPAVPVEPVASDTMTETASGNQDMEAPEPSFSAPEEPEIASTSGTAASSMNDVSSQAKPMSSTPLVIQPGRLPSGETYEEYRARLMKGLEQSGMSSFQPVTGITAARSDDGGLGTVVVSSFGIEEQAGGGGSFSVDSDGVSDAGFRRLNRDGQLLGAGSVKVATIHFSNGSDDLDNRDIHVLRQVASLYAQNGGTVRIIGHASSRTRNMDEVRHKLVNYRMSADRADAVASALVRMGLPKEAIYVGAASDRDPVYQEVMPTGEAGNRRAEIFIDS